MVKIRLRRTGKKKQPSYRVVVADSRAPRDGRFIEIIGFYNPRTEPPTVQIKEDRALYWLSQGAQLTGAVARLLRNKGTLDRFARLKEGEDLELTPLELQILKLMITRKGRVITRDEFLDHVWGVDNLAVSHRTVDSHIAHIRRKVEENPSRPKYIRSVHGIGYKFVD